jgi:8-oxo-dGTP diphosphatase
MKRTSQIFVTVDICVFRKSNVSAELLLIKRGNEPFKGKWALPGGFVEVDEDLPQAARRELYEETAIEAGPMQQLGAYGKPGRDPRQRTVSVVFVTRVDTDVRALAGDDAADLQWFSIDGLPQTAFDHQVIINDAIARFKPS